MRWSYDAEADALYVELRDGAIDRQVELKDGLIVDVSVEDEPLGVEVLAPRSYWNLDELDATFPLRSDEVESLRLLAQRMPILWGFGSMNQSAGGGAAPTLGDDKPLAISGSR